MAKRSLMAYRHTAGAGHELEFGRVRDLRQLIDIPAGLTRDPANFIKINNLVLLPHALLTGGTVAAAWYITVFTGWGDFHFTNEIIGAIGGPPPGLPPHQCEWMAGNNEDSNERQIADRVAAAAAAFERGNDGCGRHFAFFGDSWSAASFRAAEAALNP